jgi:hypothetical protein
MIALEMGCVPIGGEVDDPDDYAVGVVFFFSLCFFGFKG